MTNTQQLMRLAEATSLIQQSLTPIEKNWYTLDVVFNRNVETVRIHKKHIGNIVQDLLCGHPRCTLYAQSVRRLFKEEETFLNGKYADLDREKYDEIKWEMLELELPVDREMFQRLKSLGFNPTGAIDYDNQTRFHLNNLLRKQWRSRTDSQAGKTKQDIINEMHEALRSNPKTAFTVNRYLPSIIEYYRDRE